jgi:hypothetical protein
MYHYIFAEKNPTMYYGGCRAAGQEHLSLNETSIKDNTNHTDRTFVIQINPALQAVEILFTLQPSAGGFSELTKGVNTASFHF